jgi:signal transduction histidine kinase
LSSQTNQDISGIPLNTSSRSEALDGRSLALLRCMIAVTILCTTWISPTVVYWSDTLAYSSFATYCVYSFSVASISYRSHWLHSPKVLYWVDVYCFAWLVALTYPSGSALYQSFFYPIFVASFTRGFREGFFVTFVSFVLFMGIGLAFSLTGSQFGFGHSNTLIRGDYLLVVGYMIAYCGGYGGLFMRKLALLKEVNSHWHPRIGIDQVYGNNLDRLLEFFNGNMCILVLQREDHGPKYVMYTASRDKPGQLVVQHNVAEGAANTLLHNIPDTLAAYYHDQAVSLWLKWRGHQAYDINSGAKSKSFNDECAALANLLDTQAFVTVPYIQHGGMVGRIFLTADRRAFANSDVDFLLQASNAVSTLVESMHLVEELITKAAEQERSSISRDLHDTTIQPYIGLKLALEALSREASEDNPLSRRIHELIEMAEMTVEELRDFAATIKGKGAMPGEAMIAAIKTQADRLHRFYGITVQITSEISTQLKGRLAAEAFQIISEGLSNILRHTKAKNAYVSVLCKEPLLQLEIINDEAEGQDFMPRSIDERVQTLNGRTWVEHRAQQHTAVIVTIPL